MLSLVTQPARLSDSETVVSRLGLDLGVERGLLCKVPGSMLSTREGEGGQEMPRDVMFPS